MLSASKTPPASRNDSPNFMAILMNKKAATFRTAPPSVDLARSVQNVAEAVKAMIANPTRTTAVAARCPGPLIACSVGTNPLPLEGMKEATRLLTVARTESENMPRHVSD